jgi:hypothetical protein
MRVSSGLKSGPTRPRASSDRDYTRRREEAAQQLGRDHQ